MKKILTITTLAALCAVLAGCNTIPEQTGRSNSAEVRVVLGRDAKLGGWFGAPSTNAYDDVTHPGNLSGVVVINQHIWTETQGGEAGNTATATNDIKPSTTLQTSGGGGLIDGLAKSLFSAFGADDPKKASKGVQDIVRDALEKYGYTKKEAEACVDGLCGD